MAEKLQRLTQQRGQLLGNEDAQPGVAGLFDFRQQHAQRLGLRAAVFQDRRGLGFGARFRSHTCGLRGLHDVGLQAGAQTYGYALFFMNAKALQELDKANGFEVGVGPTVVLIDEGKAKNMTTTTMNDDIYAFVFGQKGLMAGIGIQGNKISKTDPKQPASKVREMLE